MGVPDLIGRTLDGRYCLTRLIGEGGMGQVYEAIQVTLDRKVAVKILHPRVAYERRARERFLREAKSASSIQHPNVVQILDFGDTPDGSTYLVMEHLDGRDLRQVLREEGRLSWSRAREILLQAARALGAAHARSIVHRDVKPANCFLLRSDPCHRPDIVKLVDFGLAKVGADADGGHAGQRLTGTGEVFGTAMYMAPEQARGEPLDPRSDVYSLGIVAYEMLTGQVPFQGVNSIHVITKHLDEPPRPPRTVEASIPPAVEALVLRALAKQTKDRFASMAALEAALSAIPARAKAPLRTRTIPFVAALRGAAASDTPVVRAKDRTAPAPAVATGAAPPVCLGAEASAALTSAAYDPSLLSLPAAVIERSPARAMRSGELVTATPGQAGPEVARANVQTTGGAAPKYDGTATLAARPLQPVTPSKPRARARIPILGVAVVIAAIGAASVLGTLAWLEAEQAQGVVSGSVVEPVLVTPSTGESQPPPQPAPAQVRSPSEPTLALGGGEHLRSAGESATAHTEASEQGTAMPTSRPPGTKKPKRSSHLSPECADRRRQAQQAMTARRWKDVLEATKLDSCWSLADQDERRVLRVRAFAETGDFSSCVDAGRSVEDTDAKTWVRSCENALRG